MIMDIHTEFQRVCRLAGLIEAKGASIPTWVTPDKLEAIELKKDKVITFWFKDGMRSYDQPIGSAKIESVYQAFNQKIPEIQTIEKIHSKAEIVQTEKKNELVIGSVSALAGSYGISKELADLFFMKFDNQIYIKNPGLLYLAAKKGYGHMLVVDKFDDATKEWVAEYKIYPVLTKEIIEAISKLNPAIQQDAMIAATMPTNGIGRASSANIKMKSMLVFTRELAQTRAQNRALRAYTGYGGCSAEELE